MLIDGTPLDSPAAPLHATVHGENVRARPRLTASA